MRLITYIEVQDTNDKSIIDFYSYDGQNFDAWTGNEVFSNLDQTKTLTTIDKLLSDNMIVLEAYSKLNNRNEATT